MRPIRTIILLLICVSTLFISCTEDLTKSMYTDEYAGVLYLNKNGEEFLTLYTVTETAEIPLSVVKTGNNPQAEVQAQLRMLTQEELDNQNEEQGTNYLLMPSSCFKFEGENLSFTSSEQYHIPKLILDVKEVKKAIANTPEGKAYIFPVFLTSETGKVNSQKNRCVYKPEVKTPGLIFGVDDDEITHRIAKQGGVAKIPIVFESNENRWDFSVKIEVDPSALADPNLLMPAENYSLTNGGIISFAKGELNKDLEVDVKKMTSSHAIIPLKMTAIDLDGVKIDSRTIQVVVDLKYPLTIEELSTNAQEPKEGDLKNILDNNPNSFFHSAWSISIPEKHYVQLNLKEAISNFSFSYQNRASNGNAALNNFDVSVSADGKSFELLKNFTKDSDQLPMGGGGIYKSEILHIGKEVKYIRFTCNASGTANNKYFVWSEFSIDYYE